MAWHQFPHGRHQHHVYQQQKREECAIACMLMALQRRNKLSTAGTLYRKKVGVRRNTQEPITAPELRDASHVLGDPTGKKGHYMPGLRDAGVRTDEDDRGRKRGQREEAAMSSLMSELGSVLGARDLGTYCPNIACTLKAVGLPCEYVSTAKWQTMWARVRKGQIAIARVQWQHGGGHFVVIDRVVSKMVRVWNKWDESFIMTPRKSLCVCDPDSDHGVASVAIPTNVNTPRLAYSGGTFSSHTVFA